MVKVIACLAQCIMWHWWVDHAPKYKKTTLRTSTNYGGCGGGGGGGGSKFNYRLNFRTEIFIFQYICLPRPPPPRYINNDRSLIRN